MSTGAHDPVKLALQQSGEAWSVDEKTSLLDSLLILVHYRYWIGVYTFVFTIVGFMIALNQTPMYTATGRVIREAMEEQQLSVGNLAALRGLGLNLGGGIPGLNVNTYSDIIMSREVRLAVAREQYYFSDLASATTLVNYFADRPKGFLATIFSGLKKVTIGLPRTTREMSHGSASFGDRFDEVSNFLVTTEDEEGAIEWVEKMMSVNVSPGTGIMAISVETHDPYLSVQIVTTSIGYLTQRVQALFAQKNRENLEFIQKRFLDAEAQLNEEEEALAQFIDRNRSPQTARLRTERERLQRKVRFKTDLYAELQTQMTKADIDLQWNQPVIIVMEQPLLPRYSSGPRRKLTVLISLILGFFVGVAMALVKNILSSLEDDDETALKIRVLKDLLIPAKWRRDASPSV